MDMKYKFFMVFTFLVLLFLMFLPNVYASSDYCLLSITPDKTQVQPGDTITFVLSVSNITAKNGIVIYTGLVNYSSDVFELSVQDSSNGVWKGDLLENSITFTKSDLEGTKDSQEIGKIILKVKSGASVGNQVITLKGNEFAEESSFKIADVTASVEIIPKSDSGDKPGNSSTGNMVIHNTNNSSNDVVLIVNQSNGQISANNTFSTNSGMKFNNLPYAGAIRNFSIIFFIVAVIVGSYSFYKYHKL